MFRGSFQAGFASVLFSLGSHPLQLWEQCCGDGNIEILEDDVLKSKVISVTGVNIKNTYLSCPVDPNNTLGIHLSYLVFTLKNLGKFFSFEIEVLDDTKEIRCIRASNFQSKVRATKDICTMPLTLDQGWNTVQMDLQAVLKQAYGTSYQETRRITVHANCRIRRIFFAQDAPKFDTIPPEFKLFIPPSDTPNS
eukprot:TRINITY_DN2895_c0_g1_i3.p1 TRINITY_DN2895_c0_g1~~TRINITY_DN2895_c0_g1_i3.p1  ORF type:complete len:194 (-),score=12.27 TRINITY_DN2895_c0_g1_i3:122-703(-)